MSNRCDIVGHDWKERDDSPEGSVESVCSRCDKYKIEKIVETCYSCGKPVTEGQRREKDDEGWRHDWCLSERTRGWLANRFGISKEDIDWYHSGICYDRIRVRSKEAAVKVSQVVKGKTVNGGHFHGMPLGGHEDQKDGTIEVKC